MAQWTVEGANKTTGKETSLLVEAPSEDAAREVASAQGIAVASVAPSQEHFTAAAPLNYQSPRELPAKGFFGRLLSPTLVSKLLMILALLFYAHAFVNLLLSGLLAAGFAGGSSFGGSMAPLMQFLNALLSSTTTACYGAALHVVAVFIPGLFNRLATPGR